MAYSCSTMVGMDERISAALLLMERADADPLEVAAACEVLCGFAQARQLQAIRDVSLADPPVSDPDGRLCDPAPAEIATALAWTPAAASRRVDLAHDLHDHLPDVLAALRDGRIDLGKAQEIANGTFCLTPGTRTRLARAACTYATTHTRGQLRAWLARQIARLDPQAAEERRKKAKRQRRVWIQPQPDGMAVLGAYLTAEEAQACYESLKGAVANHEGSIDAARADAFVERLTGIAPGQPIPVQVLITPRGPELGGYGPLSPAHVSHLCAGTRPIQLSLPAPTIGYRPGVRLTRFVKSRDRHCRFPGCRRPAVHCDLDHLVPWPTGSSTERNLYCLCRYHHRLKTHTGWRVQIGPGRMLRWTSPRGHHYTTSPDDP